MFGRVSPLLLGAGVLFAGTVVGVMLLVAHDDSNAVQTISTASGMTSARQLAVQACQEFYAATGDGATAHINRAVDLSTQAAAKDPAFTRLATDLSAAQSAISPGNPVLQTADLIAACHDVGVR